MNRLRRQTQRQSWLRQLPVAIGMAVMILTASRITLAQTINIDRVVAELEPEIQRTMLNQANWLIANLNGGVFKDKRIISEQTLEQMFTRQYDQFKGPVEGIWGNETAGFGLT